MKLNLSKPEKHIFGISCLENHVDWEILLHTIVADGEYNPSLYLMDIQMGFGSANLGFFMLYQLNKEKFSLLGKRAYHP